MEHRIDQLSGRLKGLYAERDLLREEGSHPEDAVEITSDTDEDEYGRTVGYLDRFRCHVCGSAWIARRS